MLTQFISNYYLDEKIWQTHLKQNPADTPQTNNVEI